MLGLIELTLALFQRKEWNRNNHIPLLLSQDRRGLALQEVRQKDFKPQCPLIFVAMNDIQHQSIYHDRRPRRAKRKFHVAAVAAFKWRPDLALNGNPHRSQKGGLINRTFSQQRVPT
jgi:hypothetical protein